MNNVLNLSIYLLNKILLIILFILIILIPTIATAEQSLGTIASSQALASDAGYQILKQGGNAIDAAVAVGYALAVTEPCCGNIGGGGFMLIHLANGQNHFINFREKSPAAISAHLFIDKNGQVNNKKLINGYLAVGVPGTVLGLNTALQLYGKLPLPVVMQPAINLAKNGFVISDFAENKLAEQNLYFESQNNIQNIFYHSGKLLQAGDKLRQPQLAITLTQIAQGGSNAFYQGNIAKQIVQASQENGGVLSINDFKSYSVENMRPIVCYYRGYQIISSPPPSSGGVTLCEMLKILQHYPLNLWGYHSVASTHVNLEAMRYAYADRNEYLGDPDFVKNPIQQLLSFSHIQNIIKQIQIFPVRNSKDIGFVSKQMIEHPQTTHYSVVDQYGNAVSVTYTLNSDFGAKVIAKNTGFFLNNEIDDFAIQPGHANQFGLIQGNANLIAPNKRPLSSMTPTIITKNGKLFLVLGSPGGSTIITTVLQVIENIVDFHFTLQQAINSPRYHMQWLPDVVFMEPNAFSPLVITVLTHMDYHMQFKSPFNTSVWGAVAAIEVDPQSGKLIGAVDNRRPDGAVVQ